MLDANFTLRQVFGEQAFGFVLRQHEREAERAVDIRDRDMHQPLAARVHACAVDFHAGIDEGVCEFEAIEELQRAAPHDEGL